MIRELRIRGIVTIEVLRCERLRAAQSHRSCANRIARIRRSNRYVAAVWCQRRNGIEEARPSGLPSDHHVRSRQLVRAVVVRDVRRALRIDIDRRKFSNTAIDAGAFQSGDVTVRTYL